MKLKKGNRVKIKGTDTLATVTKVSRDGIIHIRLDQPAGTTLRIHQSALTIVPTSATVPEASHSGPTTVPEASHSGSTTVPEASPSSPTQPRLPNGQFSEGGSHPYYPPNPANRERVATARSLRQSLLSGMASLVEELPYIISQIEEPEKKAGAINQTLKNILPQYSSIKFSDAPPRILTAEQELAELKRKYKESQK